MSWKHMHKSTMSRNRVSFIQIQYILHHQCHVFQKYWNRSWTLESLKSSLCLLAFFIFFFVGRKLENPEKTQIENMTQAQEGTRDPGVVRMQRYMLHNGANLLPYHLSIICFFVLG